MCPAGAFAFRLANNIRGQSAIDLKRNKRERREESQGGRMILFAVDVG